MASSSTPTSQWEVEHSAPIGSVSPSISNHKCNDKLLTHLNSHRIECKFDLHHKIKINEDHVRITVTPFQIVCNNVPCDYKGIGKLEWNKHFPSEICISITPLFKARGVAVEKSSRNLFFTQEISRGSGMQISPSKVPEVIINDKSSITIHRALWNYHQTECQNSANLMWVLYDVDGDPVKTKKLSFMDNLVPEIDWFHHRGRGDHQNHPFGPDGGVIFTSEQYPEGIIFEVEKDLIGHRLEFAIGGDITMTYWPNKRHHHIYSDTRTFRFQEKVYIDL